MNVDINEKKKKAGYTVQYITRGGYSEKKKTTVCPRPHGIKHHTRHTMHRATAIVHHVSYIMHRGLVKPRNEFAEGLRVVGFQRRKGIVNLRVWVWRGVPPDEVRYGKIGREGITTEL